MKKSTYIFPVILFCWLPTFQLQAQTTSNIKTEQLPEIAHVKLDKKYSKYKVNSMVKKEDKQKRTTYQIEVQKKNTVFTLVFDENGKLLSKRKSKSFTYDGTEPVRKTQPSHDGHNHTH